MAKKLNKARYRVTTWDSEVQEFTPQKGVRSEPLTKWGLRKALKQLRNLGYAADRGDNSVLVERIDDEYWGLVNDLLNGKVKRKKTLIERDLL